MTAVVSELPEPPELSPFGADALAAMNGHGTIDDDDWSSLFAYEPGMPDLRYHTDVDRAVRALRVKDAALRAFRAEQAGPVTLPAPVLLDDLLTEPDTTTRYRVDGLLPAGGRVVLAAQYKAGKTTMTGNLVRCLADGEPFLGTHAVKPCEGKIVVIDNEMPRDTIKYWLRDQGIKNTANVAVIPTRGQVGSFDIPNDEVRKRWVDLLIAYEPSVIILDCLRPVLDALGLDEDKEAGQVLVALDEIAQQCGAQEVVVIHHMGHNGERSRGSSRIRDWPDAEWRLVRKDQENPSSQRFFTAYGRDVDVAETALEYDSLTRHLTLAGGSRVDAAARAVLADLVELLIDNPGLSGRSIEDCLMGTGMPRSTARAAINIAVDEGHVITVPGPRRAVLHHPNPSSAPVRRSAPKDHKHSTETSAPVRPLRGTAAHSVGQSRTALDDNTTGALQCGRCLRHAARLIPGPQGLMLGPCCAYPTGTQDDQEEIS